jgi:hypothetical protein
MGFNPYNHSLKIQESIGNPTPQVGVVLGCEGSFSHTLLHFREYKMCLPGLPLILHSCKPLSWL